MRNKKTIIKIKWNNSKECWTKIDKNQQKEIPKLFWEIKMEWCKFTIGLLRKNNKEESESKVEEALEFSKLITMKRRKCKKGDESKWGEINNLLKIIVKRVMY